MCLFAPTAPSHPQRQAFETKSTLTSCRPGDRTHQRHCVAAVPSAHFAATLYSHSRLQSAKTYQRGLRHLHTQQNRTGATQARSHKSQSPMSATAAPFRPAVHHRAYGGRGAVCRPGGPGPDRRHRCGQFERASTVPRQKSLALERAPTLRA